MVEKLKKETGQDTEMVLNEYIPFVGDCNTLSLSLSLSLFVVLSLFVFRVADRMSFHTYGSRVPTHLRARAHTHRSHTA